MVSNVRKFCAAAAIAVALVGGAGGAANASTLSSPSAGVIQPQVAYAWYGYQDNFTSVATCTSYAFWVMETHPEYYQYQCLPMTGSPGRYTLWVYGPDGQ